MGDKEALERLKDQLARAHGSYWPHLLLGDERVLSALSAWLIAEREGLEREVERLKFSRSNWRASAIGAGVCPSCCGGDLMEPCTDCLSTGWSQGLNPFDRFEAAESKLSALETADYDVIVAVLDTFHDGQREKKARAIISALLHPTVPVERDLGSVACGLSPVSLPRHSQSRSATPSGLTPAPWHVYRHFAAPEGSGYEVKGWTRDDDVAEGMTLEDACLTAAAPDLLAALKDAVESLEQTLRWRGEGWECSEDELLGDARAAIAKASQAPVTSDGEGFSEGEMPTEPKDNSELAAADNNHKADCTTSGGEA